MQNNPNLTVRDISEMTLKACELCELGARPPVLVSLFSEAINSSKANQIYREIHAAQAPGGQLPHSGKWFLQNAKRNIQSTFVLVTYKALLKEGELQEDAFLKAYIDYHNHYGADASLDINRFWSLLNATTCFDELELSRCEDCYSVFLQQRFGSADERSCPLCKSNSHLKIIKPQGINDSDSIDEKVNTLASAVASVAGKRGARKQGSLF